MRFLLIIAISFLLCNCATQNYYYETVSSWNNGHVKSLIKQWGKPDQRVNNGNGQMSLVYYTKSYHTSSQTARSNVGVHYGRDNKPVIVNTNNPNNTWNRGSMSAVCSAVFHVNAQGKITSTETLGAGCYQSSGFYDRLKNPAIKPKFSN